MSNLFSKLQEWMSGSRLGMKLLIPSLLVFLVTLILFLTYSIATFNAENQERETEDAERTNEIISTEIQKLSDFSLGLAIQASEDPKVQEAFAARDRSQLQSLTLGSFNALKDKFSIRQYQFHLPPAQSFLRLHSLGNFGDDLSSFRATVVEVNETQKSVSGIEVGRGGVGLRGVQPVFYEGKHIGSVEFGLNIDSAFVESLKEKYGNEWRIMLTKESLTLATLQDIETLAEGPVQELLVLGETRKEGYQTPDDYQKVLGGETVTSQIISDEGQILLITTTPLRDYKGQIVGVVESLTDNTVLIQSQTNRFLLIIAGLVIVAFLGGFALITTVNRAIKPLEGLTNAARAIEQGDFSQRVEVSSQDEIGSLATIFNEMTRQIRESIVNLEQRVEARTKALQTSSEVSRRLSTILDQNTLAKEVVDQVQLAFNYYHAHIYFFDDAHENLVMAGGTGEAGAAMLASGHRIPQGRGLVGRAAETNEVVLVPDVSQSIGWLPNPLLPETQAEVAVPITYGSQVLGVLDVQHNIVNGLDANDVSLLQSLASQVAISIQNARTYEKSRQQATIETLANTIGQKIQRTTSLEEAIETAVREIGVSIGASRVQAKIGLDSQSTDPSMQD